MGAGGGGGGTLDEVKPKVPTSLTIFIWKVGGGYSGYHIAQILELGHSRNFRVQNSGDWNVVVHRR